MCVQQEYTQPGSVHLTVRLHSVPAVLLALATSTTGEEKKEGEELFTILQRVFLVNAEQSSAS